MSIFLFCQCFFFVHISKKKVAWLQVHARYIVIKSVRSLTYNDQGIYECQVNSDPYRTFKFHLSVVGEYFCFFANFFFFLYIFPRKRFLWLQVHVRFHVIKSVTYNDQDIYECQVNSDPYRTFKFHLSVVGEYFFILPMFFLVHISEKKVFWLQLRARVGKDYKNLWQTLADMIFPCLNFPSSAI